MQDAAPSDLPPRPSLAGRLATRIRRGGRGDGKDPGGGTASPRIVVALAVLVAAGPLATIAGAMWLRAGLVQDTARMEAQLAPHRLEEQRRARVREVLGVAMARPGPAALLDELAAALSPEDTLARAERTAEGNLELEVATSDPDALRSALRRQPALAQLRDVRQREGEGRTLVLLRQNAP